MKKLLLGMLCTALTGTVTAQTITKITLNVTTEKQQKITGFGAAALEQLMRPTQDIDIIDKAFDPNGAIGLNILRMEISANEKGDINASDIGWDTPYDWHGQLGAVRTAKKHGAIVFGTPWSPPGAFKTNGSSVGGNSDDQGNIRAELRDDKGKDLFIWYNRFLKYMSDNNAPVDFVSFQNEPDWWVSYSGCLYSPEKMYNVIKNNMQWLNKSYFNAGFIAGEPLGFNTDYYHRLLNDPEVNKFCDVLAGHVYGSYQCKKNIATLRAWAPEKEIWMTEHSVNGQSRAIPTWPEELDFAEDVNECLINGCTAYIYWYLCKDFGFIFDGYTYDQSTCKNATPDMKRGDILNRGYIMGQFAKNLKGATMVKNTKAGIADGKDKDGNVTTGVNQRFELSTFQKGDSIIVNVIDTMSRQFDLTINLPYEAKSVKVIESTENNLCAESNPIITPGKQQVFRINPRSFTTFIFDCPDPTAAKGIRIDEMEEEIEDRAVMINGMMYGGAEKGIIISKGKKYAM